MSGTPASRLEQLAGLELDDKDRAVLAQSDDDFHFLTWDDLKQIIAHNNLGELKRKPSDLHRYHTWSNKIKEIHGSVPNYIMKERLRWQPLPSSTALTGPRFDFQNPIPFADPNDYKILPNDWPYGVSPGIKHLVVWLKNRVDSEPSRGDVTPKSRMQIKDFIQKHFVDRVKDLPGPQEKVLWFKNWTALQSVRGMEHVHVLVRDVPEEIILEWTGGERIKQG